MKVWRLDPPECECRNLCKNPEHDRPEFKRVTADLYASSRRADAMIWTEMVRRMESKDNAKA